MEALRIVPPPEVEPDGPVRPTLGHIRPELAQRLVHQVFAAGLQVAALQSLLGEGALAERASALADSLDAVIRDIRSAVLE